MTYQIPTDEAARYRLTATLLDIRAFQLDAGQDTADVDAYLTAIVEAVAR